MIAKSNTSTAISIILDEGYRDYMEKEHMDPGKIEILKVLAEQEPDKSVFLQRLSELENLFSESFSTQDKNQVILSTIHSSKGLEYDTVYMVDVYNGRFPSSSPNLFSRSKDNSDGEQEERRLFYVGITRAKNKLYLISIKNKTSQFLAELFPNNVELSEINRISHFLYATVTNTVSLRLSTIFTQDEELLLERRKPEEEQKVAKELALRQEKEKCYQEVYNRFIQQTEWIVDHTGRRWVKCEFCGEIKPDVEFSSYGGT